MGMKALLDSNIIIHLAQGKIDIESELHLPITKNGLLGELNLKTFP
jgi:rRNA-processing protein FCF1